MLLDAREPCALNVRQGVADESGHRGTGAQLGNGGLDQIRARFEERGVMASVCYH
jgi:hypothetical protein